MNTPHKQLINLFKGWPSLRLLPNSLLAQASASAFTDPITAYPALSYGPDPGYEPLRKAIANWLTDFYVPSTEQAFRIQSLKIDHQPDHERICITGGASQNLACVLQVFSDPLYTRNIWCVAPMYYLAGRIFEDNSFGGRLRAIPEDDQGIDIVALENGLRSSHDLIQQENNDHASRTLKPRRDWSKFYRHIIYAVPTFSNPSSKTMSFERRVELVRLARKYDALIITDDVYDQLQWHANPSSVNEAIKTATQPRIVDVDRYLDGGAKEFGNAMSNGSFSKIVAPGARTGWAEGTKQFTHALSQCGTSRSGGAASQAMAVVLTDMVQTGQLQERITDVLQPTYQERYMSMIKNIESLLVPLGITLPQTDRSIVGGYFIWIALPKGFNGDLVAKRAEEEENLILGPGSFFVVSGDEANSLFDGFIRLSLSWEDGDLLQEGIQRLANLIKRMLDEEDYGKGR